MRFTVRLTHANGEVLLREFEADSTDALRARVLSEGGFPLEITRTDTAFRSRSQLKIESLVLFNQELLALLKAGIPLLQSLELLVGHGKDVQLRRSLAQVVELVREGLSFSDALEQTGTFPPIYRSNVVAGERSGTLPEVLARWLSFQKFAQNSRRRIIEALFYPAFLVVVAGGVAQLKGTLIAAWAVGVATAFLTDWTSGSMAQVITFALVVVFLQIRPQGLFTVRTRALA